MDKFVKVDDNSINVYPILQPSGSDRKKGWKRVFFREALSRKATRSSFNPLLFPSLNKVNTFTYAARVSLGRDVRTANNYLSIVTFTWALKHSAATQVVHHHHHHHHHISRFLSFAYSWKFKSSQIARHVTFSPSSFFHISLSPSFHLFFSFSYSTIILFPISIFVLISHFHLSFIFLCLIFLRFLRFCLSSIHSVVQFILYTIYQHI